jgi:P27 family predicted phage terminase small subunit
LYRSGLLTPFDVAVFAAYCQAYGRWVVAERALAGADLVVDTVAGNRIVAPLLGVVRRAMADMMRAAVEMGLSPSARSRVTATPPPSPDDEAAARYFD